MSVLDDKSNIKKKIQSLGVYLPNIRNGFGWSLEDLGERLDVSKQTISNIESTALKNFENDGAIEKDCMTYAQYVTLRLIIQNELENLNESNPDRAKEIHLLVKILVDEDLSELKDDDKEKLKGLAGAGVASAVATSATLATFSTMLKAFGIIGATTASVALPVVGGLAASLGAIGILFGTGKNKKKEKRSL